MTPECGHGPSLLARAGLHALTLLLFFLLTALFTWPLILHPGTLLRGLNDPFLFTWILNWAAQHLSGPVTELFNANIFYPYGNTFAYSEPLLIPALLTAAPILTLSHNPVLAHNLTLLIFQALGGWCAYLAAGRITGSRAAGWLVGIAFTVSPFRTGYYNYINVHMQFAVPLALLTLALYLEQERKRWLAATVLLVWAQMITIFYGGVPLAMLLAFFCTAFLLLRPGRLSKALLLQCSAAALLLLLLLVPVLWPYYTVFRELGLERSLADVQRYSADWYSFFDAGKDHRFYRLAHSGKYPGFFPGFAVYLPALLALLSLWRPDPALTLGPISRRLLRLLGGLVTLLALAAVWMVTNGTGHLGNEQISLSLSAATTAILLLGLLALVIRGRAAGRQLPPALVDREWIVFLALASLFFGLLTLGPEMTIQGRPVGTGLYAWIYRVFLPLHTIRLSIRLGWMPVLLLAMLAGFGLVLLERRLPGRARLLIWLAPLLLAVEYVSFPLPYRPVHWDRPPAVVQWLKKQPGDFAILEWPTNNEEIDSHYVFWSLFHAKTEVSGVSGFFPPFTRRVTLAMSRFPSPASISWLRRIYPLRYLIVHEDLFLKPEHRQLARSWAEQVPGGMVLVRRFGPSTVYRFADIPEPLADKWERTFSSSLARRYPVAGLELRTRNNAPLASPCRIRVTLNDRLLETIAFPGSRARYEIHLEGSLPAADRNILRLTPVGHPMDREKEILVSDFELTTPQGDKPYAAASGPDDNSR